MCVCVSLCLLSLSLSLSLKRGLAQLILLFKDDLVVVEDFDIINLLAPMPVLEANFGVDCAIIIECAEGGSVLGIHLELVPYLVATHGLDGVAIPILAVMIERRRVFGKHLERVDYRRHSPPYCSQLPVARELFCSDRHLAAPSESVFVRWYQ